MTHVKRGATLENRARRARWARINHEDTRFSGDVARRELVLYRSTG
jgi:hypothetical protein